MTYGVAMHSSGIEKEEAQSEQHGMIFKIGCERKKGEV